MFDLRHLRYLTVLAKRLNYARAADELGITQSALSRSVQSLEQDYGIRLFERGRGGVSATLAGRQIIDRALGLLANADDLESHLRNTAQGDVGELSFGIAPVPARALLARSLQKRLRQAPKIRNNVFIRSFDALLPMLLAGEIEFIVSPIVLVPDFPPLRCEKLGDFPVNLIVRPGHPLLSGASLDNHFPFLLSGQSVMPHSAPAELLDESGGVINLIEDFDTLIHVTRNSDAVWLTSTYAVADEIAQGTLAKLSKPAAVYEGHFTAAIFSLDRSSPSPLAKLMKQSLRHRFNSLVRDHAAG